ncbi:MAG: hypothetical protein K8S99_00770 [Planctomycetes bacterium]|nr:hypothetical protein [Planctomycetota bacterium]
MKCLLSLTLLTALALTSIACETTTVERHYREDTTTTSDPKPVDGQPKAHHTETETTTSEPKIIVE